MTTAVPRKLLGTLYREWRTCFAADVSDIYDDPSATDFGTDFELGVFHYQQLGAGTTLAKQNTASARVDAIHAAASAAGHDAVVAVYVNGTFVAEGEGPTSGSHLPGEYLPSGVGASPYFVDSGDTWLMDPRSYGQTKTCGGTGDSVPDQFNRRRATYFGATNADAGFEDSLGWGIVTASYNDRVDAVHTGTFHVTAGTRTSSVAPTNLQTGNTWISAAEKAAWTGFTVGLPKATAGTYGREGATPTGIHVNGVSRGTRWFDPDGPTAILAEAGQLCTAENWIRDASESLTFGALQPVGDWLADVNFVVDCQNRGRGATLWTKVWATHVHTDDRACTVNDVGDANQLVSPAHGFASGDTVTFQPSTTRPGGIGTGVYTVVRIDASTFQVTSGGGVVNLTSAGVAVKARPLVSQNADDDGNNVDIRRWHRLFAASFMLCTNGRSFANFVHDYSTGNQRIPKDRWRDKINAMGWFTESFNGGVGVWADVSLAALADNEFSVTAHGFSTNQQVLVEPILPGGNLPTGISPRVKYFVRPGAAHSDADHFSLATASGGGAINLQTPPAAGYRVRVRSYDGSQGSGCGIAAAKDPTSTNLYVRHFEHGIVVCNPTGDPALNTYTLPAGTWYDVDDTALSGTITVDNTKYAVLLRDAL